MDLVAEIVKEAAKYGMVPRIKPRQENEVVLVMMCKPPETQCCVSVSLAGLDELSNSPPECLVELIACRVSAASRSIEFLQSQHQQIEPLHYTVPHGT